ncbi:MAG: hypothetical protein EAZ64_09570 [Sphingobacteriales bacterium]|nr:MAG: hypothetical protein EAZ64_09570 [Sphingobacteriales bacterium]
MKAETQTTTQLMPTHLQAHLIFSQHTTPTLKKIKRACKPTHPTVQWFVGSSTDRALNVACFEHPASKLPTVVLRTDSRAAGNSTFAIGGVSCSADSLVVAESLVLRINISGKKPAHRKSAKRYQQA